MKIIFEQQHGLPCRTKEFNINGRIADIHYFGKATTLNDPDSDDELDRWGCRNRIWRRYTDPDLIQEMCCLYDINEIEYDELCDMLEEKLSLGNCGWCI